jgi:PAS domain S-box-containing protein
MLSRYKSSIKLIAAISTIAGVLVIIGWLTGNQLLKGVLPGLPVMKFNTAVCFVLTGVSLYLITTKYKPSYYIQTGLSLIIIAIVAITFVAPALGINTGIDEWFIKDTTPRVFVNRIPGRMAATTGFCFLLTSLSFIAIPLAKKNIKIAAQYALHIVTLISFISILGYIYKMPDFYTLSFFSSMALNTAVLLFTLSVTASFVNYTLGFTGLFTGQRMGSIMARNLFPLIAIVVILLGMLRMEMHLKNMVSVNFGIALFATSFILASLLLISITAKYLNKVDAKRKLAEAALKEFNTVLGKKVAEKTKELQQITERLSLATKGSNIGIWDWDIEKNILTWDEKMYELYGINEADFSGAYDAWVSGLHPEDREAGNRAIENSIIGKKEFNIEFRVVWPDASVHYIKANALIQRNEAGKAIRMVGTNVDITQQKLQFEQIQQSEEKYHTMVAGVQDYAIILLDADGIIQNWNKGAEKIKGYTEEEIKGKNFHIFYTAKDIENNLPDDLLNTAKEKGKVFNENWRVKKDGSLFWGSVLITALYNSENKITGFTKVTRDLTETKRAEEAIRINERKFQIMLEAIGDNAWEHDFTTGKTTFAANVKTLFGHDAAEFTDNVNFWWQKTHDDDSWVLNDTYKKYRQGLLENHSLEYRVFHKDGTIKWVLDRGVIIERGDDGKPVKIIGTHTDITERKEQAEKIRRSEERYFKMVDAVEDYSIILLDKEGNVQNWNKGAEKMKGYKEAEILGKNYRIFFTPENQQEGLPENLLNNAKKQGHVFTEGLRVKKDGSPFWVSSTITPLYDETKELIGFSKVVRDITDRHISMQKLQASEEQLKAIFTGAPDAVIVIDEEGIVSQWNSQATNIFGWRAEEVTGHSLTETIVPPKYREAHQAGMSRFLKTGKSTILGTNVEIQAITKDNSEIDIALTISPIQMKGHQMFIGFVRDITQQKKKDEIILNNERKFRLALGVMGDNVWEHDFITDKTFFADTIQEFIGYTNQEIFDKVAIWWRLVHPDDHWMLKQNDIDYRAGLISSHHLEYRIHNKDGNLKWVLDRGVVVEKDNDGKPLKIVGTHTDITPRKTAEASLDKLKKQFQSFMEHIPAMAWIVDKQSVYQFTNDNYVTTFYNDLENGDHEQLVGKSFFELFPPEIAELYKSNNDIVFNGNKVLETIEPSVDRAGNKITLKVFKFPLQINNAETLLGGVAIDITELVKAEENMRHLNEKISASNKELEQFAYVASHDLQEPLRMVSSFMQLLEKKYSPDLDDTAKQYIHFAVDGAERMKKLILDLLSFSRIGTEQQYNDNVDVNEIIKEVKLNLMSAISENNATIEVKKMPVIKANKLQISQLFQNLVNNAIKYRSEKNPEIEIGFTEEPGHYCFYVKDNGIGIDSKYFEKIFVIFQRLHNRNEFSGTGIGLSICKKIAEKHKGYLKVESKPGEGSTFTFFCPKK